MRVRYIGLLIVVIGVLVSAYAWAHCEIPCGIYDDQMRIQMIQEHITTIEKSMKQIEKLSQGEPSAANQIVRWVNNKEHHAEALTEIVTQYFMTQRIKPAHASNTEAHGQYVRKLTLLHQMMIASMKCKQTTDLENVTQLRSLLADFRTAYLGPAATEQSR